MSNLKKITTKVKGEGRVAPGLN